MIRAFGITWRVSYANAEVETELRKSHKQVIYSFWHGGLLAPCFTHRGRGITTLISQHRDGELIARTILRMGFRVSRGSSSRGGAAGLKGMCDAAAAGYDLAMVPDGPRGPAKQVQPGVVALSSLTRLPILPSGIAFSNCWRLNSWDRFVIPKPFSRICIGFGEPFVASENLTESQLKEAQERVRLASMAAEETARRGLEGKKPS